MSKEPTSPNRFPAIPRAVILAVIFWMTGIFFILTVRGDLPAAQNKLSGIPGLKAFIRQRQQTTANASRQTLNYYIPTFEYLCEFISNPGTFDKTRLRGWDGYLDYYEKVIPAMPELAEGHALTGFFYFQEGDSRRAAEAFQKSCQINPHLFWPRYNLAVLQLRDKEYEKAAQNFALALRANPEANLRFLLTSKLYQQIRMTTNFNYDLAQSLRQGYQNAAALGQLSQKLRDNPDIEFKIRLDLKIF